MNTAIQEIQNQRAIGESSQLAGIYSNRENTPRIEKAQIQAQFRLAVEMVLGEGGYYAPAHAATALKQSEGDILEAAAILRCHRQTIERRQESEAIDTRGMIIERRISSAFREIPGGQILGPTLDYTQRILEPTLASENMESIEAFLDNVQSGINREDLPRDNQLLSKVSDLLRKEGLMKAAEDEDKTLVDVTREPLRFPVPRSGRLQMLAMSQTGALLALGYSGQRGFGGGHGTVGELRVGRVPVPLTDRLGRRRTLGLIRVTEAEMITRIEVKKKNTLPHMVIGYGLCFGQNETKAISMGGIDRSMRRGNDDYPCQSQEFVLHHTAGVDAWGSLRSLMIPSHTAFAADLQLLRSARSRAKQEQTPTQPIGSHFSAKTTPTEPSSS